MTRHLSVCQESFPIRGSFRIARGARTVARVVVAEISEGGVYGRGECVPYARYGETVEGVLRAVERARPLIENGADRATVQAALPAGAARNAIDCALWDLEAKRSGLPAWQLAGISAPRPVTTAYTLSLDSVENMAAAAHAAAAQPLLKLKLGGDDDDLERIEAVRRAAPTARLLVDANESWSLGHLAELAPACAEAGVTLIEQPLPAGQDEALRGIACPVPLGADESFHVASDVDRLAGLYQVVNIKLDKTGGLTAALAAKARARAAGLGIMAGCMVGTSLAMAPAVLLAQGADFVDLDGPLLLAADRQPGLVYRDGDVYPAAPALWG